jgi:hypothetical protein
LDYISALCFAQSDICRSATAEEDISEERHWHEARRAVPRRPFDQLRVALSLPNVRPADIKYWNIFKELAKRDQESLQQKKLLQKSFYTKNIRASYQYPSFNFA